MSIYVKMDHLTRIAGKNIYFIDTMSFPHSQAPLTYVCPLAYANVIFDHWISTLLFNVSIINNLGSSVSVKNESVSLMF